MRFLLLILFINLLIISACKHPVVPGCTDPLAYNYDPDATVDDTSCCFQTIDTLPINIFVRDPDQGNFMSKFRFQQVQTIYTPKDCSLDEYVTYLSVQNIDSTHQQKITFNYTGSFVSSSHNWSFNGSIVDLPFGTSEKIGILTKKPTSLDLGIFQIVVDTVIYTP